MATGLTKLAGGCHCPVEGLELICACTAMLDMKTTASTAIIIAAKQFVTFLLK